MDNCYIGSRIEEQLNGQEPTGGIQSRIEWMLSQILRDAIAHIKEDVATVAALPTEGNSVGDMRYVTATSQFYIWKESAGSASWVALGSGGSSGGITGITAAGMPLTPVDGVVDIPVTSAVAYGLAKISSIYGVSAFTNGILLISMAEPSVIESRIATAFAKYKPITAGNLDYAVKAAMTDGIGDAWTDAEKKRCMAASEFHQDHDGRRCCGRCAVLSRYTVCGDDQYADGCAGGAGDCGLLQERFDGDDACVRS